MGNHTQPETSIEEAENMLLGLYEDAADNGNVRVESEAGRAKDGLDEVRPPTHQHPLVGVFLERDRPC